MKARIALFIAIATYIGLTLVYLTGCSSMPQPSAVKVDGTYNPDTDAMGVGAEIDFPLPTASGLKK